ncbi:hypothetical protein [Hathewaya massiliensis]|uniref:hypothetical protein n=1 Tax=Hathewaya massiliensis TaxID=1964382 RepID=UPI00115A4481|nr:hypothetical protein [Hathewaya massiliensis]
MEYIIIGGILILSLYILAKQVKKQLKGEGCNSCPGGCNSCNGCPSKEDSVIKTISKKED